MYGVVMMDPPWPKRRGGVRRVRPLQGRPLGYETMSVDEIFSLLDRDIFPALTAPASVFLWSIDAVLHESERQMLSRGYKLHARMVWDKGGGVAPAFTVRYSHEYFLWFYTSPMPKVHPSQRGKFTTVIHERAREHSRKPEAAYQMVEALFPMSARLDVFARQRRGGWDAYGDQVDHFEGVSVP